MTVKTVSRIIGCALALGVTLTMTACGGPGTTPTPTDSQTLSTPSDTAPTTAPTTTPSSTPATTATPTTSPSMATEAPTKIIPKPTNSVTMDGVSATGAFGTKPVITVPSPWGIQSTQWRVLVKGTGPVVTDTSAIEMNYVGINGRTGKTFDSSFDRGTPYPAQLGSGVIAGFTKALKDQTVGSRVLMAIASADAYDGSGGQASAGIDVGDTLVFVVDILRTSVTKPQGAAQTLTDPNLPTLGGTEDAPTLVFPAGVAAPATAVVKPLIVGDQPDAKVVATDTIVMNYTEYIWGAATPVRTTYGYSPVQGKLSDMLAGWQSGLLGQPIGSRVLLVLPPDQSYPQGNPKIAVPAGSTMVYIVDILFATSNG